MDLLVINELWNTFKNDKNITNKNKIYDYIDFILKNCVRYYTEYYRKEGIEKKFKNVANIEILIENIKRVKILTYLEPIGQPVDTSWGYIYTNDLYTIHINVYNFFNDTINANIYDTVVHEMAHLIDFMLRSLNETPSYMEEGYLNAISKSDMYIISREEDYARIQRLRNILGLTGFDIYQDLTDKLDELIKVNKISVMGYKFEISQDRKSMDLILNKNVGNLKLVQISSVLGHIEIGNYLATDIGYLFAKYARVVNGRIKIDLIKINNINNKFVDISGDEGNFA